MPRRARITESLVEGDVIPLHDPLLPLVAEEVEYALYPPPHENKLPTYGCLISLKPPNADASLMDVSNVSPEIVRQLADGTYAFAYRVGETLNKLLVGPTPYDEELSLINLAQRSQAVLVHRSFKGAVRVFTGGGIRLFRNDEWLYRPYAFAIGLGVWKFVTGSKQGVLESILDFAFHYLSPWHVGTTMVWWLGKPKQMPKGTIDLSQIGLSVVERGHLPSLRALLQRYDRAMVVGNDGTVDSLGFLLSSSEQAAEIVPATGGTRHTSARRYSYDQECAFVITVSEDGPVTVFLDGARVTELAQSEPGDLAVYLKSLAAKEIEPDILTDVVERKCPTCGKTIEIEVTIVPGMREEETVECPICEKEIYRKSCWQLTARLKGCSRTKAAK